METFIAHDMEALHRADPRLTYHLLTSAVVPRPIAFASTMGDDGVANLAPFSYFNLFSANPPLLVFSPNRSGRTQQPKDTFWNVLETGEVVINLVSHAMVNQMVLASADYPREVDEWAKSGFTPLKSELVRPARVAESPVQFECRVQQVVTLGQQGGAGNLIICEVVRMHVAQSVADGQGAPDPLRLDTVARLGGAWYSRVTPESLFEAARPVGVECVGMDGLPESLRQSAVLLGSQLAALANVPALPTKVEAEAWLTQQTAKIPSRPWTDDAIHRTLAQWIEQGWVADARLLAMAHYYAV